jgi:hypothetical protein
MGKRKKKKGMIFNRFNNLFEKIYFVLSWTRDGFCSLWHVKKKKTFFWRQNSVVFNNCRAIFLGSEL